MLAVVSKAFGKETYAVGLLGDGFVTVEDGRVELAVWLGDVVNVVLSSD